MHFDIGKVKIKENNYFNAITDLDFGVIKINDNGNDLVWGWLWCPIVGTYPTAIRDRNIHNYRIKRLFRASRLSAIPLVNRSRNAVRSPHCFDEYETDFTSPILLCSPGTFACNFHYPCQCTTGK